MSRKTKQINWSDELAKAVKIVGTSLLKLVGWVLSIIMTLGLVVVITGTIVGGAFLLYAKNYLDTSVDGFDVMIKEKNMTSTVSYVDSDGNIVELTSERLNTMENRMWVKYADFNEYIADAFIAIEDKRFEKHDGVDWLSTVKVTLQFFTGQGMRGASTITQQVIKNVTGDDDVTIQRKAQEILKALNLEKKYDKTEILEMYLNNIYLSQGCYGIGAASYAYFGKEVKDLTLIESAALACITQYPYYYDPIINPENNTEKRNVVIKYMYDQGRITQEEFLSAYNKELVLNIPSKGDDTNSVHSWYTDAAQQEATRLLQEKFGYTASFAEKVLLTGGYNIVTAQDPEIQEIVEYYYENEQWKDENGKDDGKWERHDDSPIQPNSSCVVIDPTNGNVVALVGSRGRKTINLGLNYATQTKRPAGSSIKPVSVYAPAFENGVITYATVLDDTPVNFGTEKVDPETGLISYGNSHGYPKNSPDEYRGLVTMSTAVARSKNTISWKILERLGLENSFEFLTEELGLSTLVRNETSASGHVLTDIAYAPLAMGEFTWGVTVKELTSSYQIFANGGIYNEERLVLKILDSNGEVVVDNEKKSSIVISEQNASIMTKLLQDVVTKGTATNVTLRNTVNCAGKTGTTENNRDKWFVGYTPYYVCGVWFGYSMPRSLEGFNASKTVPIVLWDKIMTKITQKYVDEAKNGGAPLKKFELAPGIIKSTYCACSGKLLTDACKADPRGSSSISATGYFVLGTEPTEYCDRHVLVDYDNENKAIALPGCNSDNIIKVGLVNYLRVLPFNITITDAQYTCQILPENYSYEGLTEKMPYYANILPEGFFTGHTKNSYYNHVCLVHRDNPFVPETQPPETTVTTELPVIPDNPPVIPDVLPDMSPDAPVVP